MYGITLKNTMFLTMKSVTKNLKVNGENVLIKDIMLITFMLVRDVLTADQMLNSSLTAGN